MTDKREILISDFKELIQNDRLPHAYLFFGAGEEKFNFGRALANFLEKEKFEEPEEFLSELLVISPNEKGNIGIDKIKDLKYYIWQEPTSSSRRMVIVESAETLTADAQNAALKIVEEPPSRGLIIFLANAVEDILPTLNSRLQKIYFPHITQINPDKNQIHSDKKNDQRNQSSNRSILEFDGDETDEFFRKSIENLMKDPVKNSGRLKEILRRLVLVKRFNLNKKLQIRSLE